MRPAGGVADERSVDMDERRGEKPAPETGARLPVVAAAASLSPVQQAYQHYLTHRRHCLICRDVDRGECDEAAQLWRDYQATTKAAYRQLGDETA